jgi:UDP-4-amino-4,6-dideoxy-N-acetyl-beta-L-altrosamine N-acetyltransferase
MSFALRPMTAADLDRVLAWRNRPEVRANVFSSHVISPAEHAAWYARAAADPARRLLIFEIDGAPAGFVQLSGLGAAAGAVTFGMYADGRGGLGRALGFALLDYAFRTLGLSVLAGEALAANARALAVYRALGFTFAPPERRDTGEGPRDVIPFTHTQTAWETVDRPRLVRALAVEEPKHE